MNNSITGKALVILIDNSPNSIDGDFYPNRLEAQKIAIERLSTYLFSICTYSQVALITMSPDEFGIRSSFTISSSKISDVLRNIYSTSSLYNDNSLNFESINLNNSDIILDHHCTIMLEKALKTALVMVNHLHYTNFTDNSDQSSNKGANNINDSLITNCSPHVEKQILAFICSKHDVISEQKMEDIKKEALSKEAIINIVAFGPDVNEKEILRKLTELDNDSISSPTNIANIQNNCSNHSNFISSKSNPLNSNILNSLNSAHLSKKKIISNGSNKKNKSELHSPNKIANSTNSSSNNISSSSGGEFIDIPFPTDDILSDIVLSSRIGTGNVKPQIPVKALLKTNPELFEAVYEMLFAYKQQAGNSVDSNVEHQIQLLENCSSASKTPQRSNIKIQKTKNNSNLTTTQSENILDLGSNLNNENSSSCNNDATDKADKVNESNNDAESNSNSSSVFEPK